MNKAPHRVHKATWLVNKATLPGVILAGVLAGSGGIARGAPDSLDALIGRALFNRPWVPAPASTRADDGLGPLFDARSCASCHRGGGRAGASVDANNLFQERGVVLVLARPDGSGDPVYGRRLQVDAVRGLPSEAILGARDTALPDGRRARVPATTNFGYGPLAPGTGMSLRVAPDLRGRGEIERVSDAALLELEAAQANRTDGVRGRARRVISADGRPAIGRFGWKASQPTLAAQTAEAFLLDLGLSTTSHPEPWGDCTPKQVACRNAPHGGGSETAVEIPDTVLDRVVSYVASLPVPAPSAAPSNKDEALFTSVGCAACHVPSLPGASGMTGVFSDLLLHDMGEELADTMPEPGAAAAEWRTAPLAGLTAALARGTGLLHDGRAQSVETAVLWHGGQGAATVRRFRALSRSARTALLHYVSSL